MMRERRGVLWGRVLALGWVVSMAVAVPGAAQDDGDLGRGRVRVAEGVLEGSVESGIVAFRGIPFGRPPVGDLRWQEPRPGEAWQGVRQARKFGPRCMQQPIFGDMNFRSDGVSEDCLYLNIWTPARNGDEALPVLVYFYGGGFMAGDGSEPRYDGEMMARRGMVTVTVNYRLGVFGFLSHPELTAESGKGASGNYGLLDQSTALHWLKRNVATFGGDPARITIVGESAGSASVSALMVSPLSRDLIAGAMLSSGAMVARSWPSATLLEAEARGVQLGASLGAGSLAAMRALPADRLLEEAGKLPMMSFGPIVDGYFLTEDPVLTLAAGRQARVPLLGGWNSEEMTYRFLFGELEPTVENYRTVLKRLYAENADAVFAEYPATDPEQVVQSATDLAGDRFIAFSTWKWIDLHARTSGKPVYRYLYARPRPAMRPEMGSAVAGLAGGVIREPDAEARRIPPARGAVHSADIEYAMGNLSTNRVYDWEAADHRVSAVFQSLYENFVKTGSPGGLGVPEWPPIQPGAESGILLIDAETRVVPEPFPGRYQLLNRVLGFLKE